MKTKLKQAHYLINFNKVFLNRCNIKTVSLALGSGSAKGIAHIGVIEAIESSGYNINAVAGTSMGAIIAAYYALGKLDLFKSWVRSLNKKGTFLNLDLSFKGGIFAGDKFIKNLEGHLHGLTFRDCKIPLYIVATNYDLAREEVFQSDGDILDAIRASISIPGVIKPHKVNNHFYIDGAVSNPVPVNVLYRMGHKNIVAVNLNEHIEMLTGNTAPGIFENMSRSMSLVSKFLADAKTYEAMSIIAPNLNHIGMIDLYKSDEIIAEGFAATKLQMIADRFIDKRGRLKQFKEMIRLA